MKKIIVEECMSCLLVQTCKEFNSLSPEQKFAAKFSHAVRGILKTCPLSDDIDVSQLQKENEDIKYKLKIAVEALTPISYCNTKDGLLAARAIIRINRKRK